MTRLAILTVLVAACSAAKTPASPPAAAPAAAQAPAAPAATAERTLRYDVVFGDRVVGRGAVTLGDRVRSSHYEFEDRGRGPNLDARVELDGQGRPRALTLTGKDYLRAPVDEKLVLDGDVLRWTAASDQGSAPAGSGFYLTSDSTIDTRVILVGALRAAPGRRLPILPGGEAWIESETPHDIAVAGGTRRLVQVAIGGLGFTPTLVWLDESGELFANPSRWFSVVAEGAAASLPALLAADDAWRAAHASTLAKALTHTPPAAGLVITNARLFDPRRRTVRDGQTIVVVGDSIQAVGPASRVRIPAGAEVVDAAGKTVLPGLFDMHVHLHNNGLLHLAAGVTSVRDLGNDLDQVDILVGRFESGAEIGPRVTRAALVDSPGPLVGPTKLLATTPEEARAIVETIARRGHDQIKIYSSVKPELVPVFIEAARARKMRVSGHIPAGITTAQAVKAGYDEFQHIMYLIAEHLHRPEDDPALPLRSKQVAERAADVDLASPSIASLIRLLRTRKTVVDPTLVVFEDMFTARRGETSPTLRAVAERLPATVQRGLRTGGFGANREEEDRNTASFAVLKQLVKMLHRAGVTMVAGTDNLAGFTLHRELELYVEAGIPAPEVLAMATLVAARVAGRDKELGTVEVGKRADLVIVPGDPLTDISALRRTETVISRGRRHQTAELYAAAGVKAP